MDEYVSGRPSEEALDPGVQIELENLNSCTEEINKLEMQLDEANEVFRHVLTDSTQRLKTLAKKIGSGIEKARPYYEAKEIARQAQLECQQAAVQFQRANEIHQAAKETIALAEARFLSKKGEWEFDSAWQEMLNYSTMKVMEAEKQRAESEAEHQRAAAVFTEAERRVQSLEKKLHKHIIRSKAYFEAKEQLHSELTSQKSKVHALHREVTLAKQKYADALSNLECISDRIHARRRMREDEEREELVDFDIEDLERASGGSALGSSYTSDAEDEGIDSVSSQGKNSDQFWDQVTAEVANLTLDLAKGGISREEQEKRIRSVLDRTVCGNDMTSITDTPLPDSDDSLGAVGGVSFSETRS
ncbi:unnamed protein product [Cyprideis torosa]|uniref:Uncharacterized protein n=1 Tax=Cyprideis torosa TaxID=163714 RepID=A0A7R8W4S4_9CRUS|nr:unnamed protein product [Cyprideis torosa]CAG0879131.1 unnamed protein product [Cyprideis torosa]